MRRISRLAPDLRSLGQRVSKQNVFSPPSVRQFALRGKHTLQPPSPPSQQAPSPNGPKKSTDHVHNNDVNHGTSDPLNEGMYDYVYKIEPTIVPVPGPPGKPSSWKVTFTKSWVDPNADQPLHPATSLQILFEHWDSKAVVKKVVYRRIPVRKVQRDEKGVFWVVFPNKTGHMVGDGGLLASVWLHMWMGTQWLGRWRLKRG